MQDELELMIYCMRKSLDQFIQGIYSSTYSKELGETGKVAVDSVGSVLNARQKKTVPELVRRVFGDDEGKICRFLTILNIVSNCYKHGYFLPDSLAFASPERPNIVLFDIANRAILGTPTVHNHAAVHLMMGYQDVFDRLLAETGARPLFSPAK